MRKISELSSEANSYNFSVTISFPSWLHVCRTLMRESQVYDAEDADLERAFVLYLRYSDLVLNKLRKHPHFSLHKAAYKKLASQVPLAIERSEALKRKILHRHKEQQVQLQKTLQSTKEVVPQLEKTTSELNDLESELEKYASEAIEVPEIDLNAFKTAGSRPTRQVSVANQSTYIPEYPSYTLPSEPASSQSAPAPPPPYSAASDSSPEPETEGFSSKMEFQSVFQTERGQKLRTVFVPSQLRQKFLAIAAPNTRANLETCGMLCGKLKRNAFFVTDLVIPHQESTSDSCATTDEEQLFEYVDSRDLFIVGWIHTHPTQTCFMSSVDLHTHASYQLMLPEAIAIVCAPTSNPDWGAFRLTDPPGIDVIKNCRLTGFHQHTPNEGLYRSTRPNGHYKEIQFDLVAKDLRR